MLVYQKHWCSAVSTHQIKRFLLKRSPTYHPFESYEIVNSWGVNGFDGWQDLLVMEGLKVSRHTDGGAFWQPMLILENYQARWSFRGSSQKVSNLQPQYSGTFVVLDIERSHCVTGRSSLPWMALCWNPWRSVPQQSDFSLDEVIEAALEAFTGLLTSVLENQEAAA
jgi:hypothetical protein